MSGNVELDWQIVGNSFYVYSGDLRGEVVSSYKYPKESVYRIRDKGKTIKQGRTESKALSKRAVEEFLKECK